MKETLAAIFHLCGRLINWPGPIWRSSPESLISSCRLVRSVRSVESDRCTLYQMIAARDDLIARKWLALVRESPVTVGQRLLKYVQLSIWRTARELDQNSFCNEVPCANFMFQYGIRSDLAQLFHLQKGHYYRFYYSEFREVNALI